MCQRKSKGLTHAKPTQYARVSYVNATEVTTSMRHTQTTHKTIEAVEKHGIKALRCGPNGPEPRTTTKYDNE